jgi:hypothetical protein
MSRRSLCLSALVLAFTAASIGTIPGQAGAQTGGPKSFKVQLPGNPSEGHIWQYNPAESTNAQLVTVTPLGYGNPANRSRTNAISPNHYYLRITPLGTGQAILVFDYLPSGGGEPKLSHELTVNLNP